MPPFYDVYVRVPAQGLGDALARFVDRYVAAEQPRERRLPAVLRTYVESAPRNGDAALLDELRRDPLAGPAFAIYLRATSHAGAVVALTEESELVLGLSLDDPTNSPAVWEQGRTLASDLLAEFCGTETIAGVEIPPPLSSSEWDDALRSLVDVRSPS